MFFVSEKKTTAPAVIKTPLQEASYRVLEELQIPYERVDTDEAITMEDCASINEVLDMKMVKTLFLCNRKQTAFYLFVTTADKLFQSKEFSKALDVSRVSFAPAVLLEKMLGTKIGAATVFSVLLDNGNAVQIVFDNDIMSEEWFGCSDGTTMGYLKIKTAHIISKLLPYAKHVPAFIQI